MERKCDNCSKTYIADMRNIKRGWGLCCSKSCAASKREKSRLDYNPITVARNNRIREGRMTVRDWSFLSKDRQRYLTYKMWGCDAPNIIGSSGMITGITSEGYRIMDGTAYNEFDQPMYDYDEFEDNDYGWDSHK